MINSDAVLTDDEIRQQIIDLLTEYHRKNDIAPTLSRIFDQMRVAERDSIKRRMLYLLTVA